MDGKLVAKVLLPAEVLPVGIFYPTGDYFLIRDGVDVLQAVQSGNQPRSSGWPTLALNKQFASLFLKAGPIDLAPQYHQLVTHIQQVLEAIPE